MPKYLAVLVCLGVVGFFLRFSVREVRAARRLRRVGVWVTATVTGHGTDSEGDGYAVATYTDAAGRRHTTRLSEGLAVGAECPVVYDPDAPGSAEANPGVSLWMGVLTIGLAAAGLVAITLATAAMVSSDLK